MLSASVHITAGALRHYVQMVVEKRLNQARLRKAGMHEMGERREERDRMKNPWFSG